MDRALRANVITKSGGAVETAGDIDNGAIDKTGTITHSVTVKLLSFIRSSVDENLSVEAFSCCPHFLTRLRRVSLSLN